MKLYHIILTSLAVAALAACAKEEIAPKNDIAEGEKQIITATVNAQTKLAYSEDATGFTSKWEKGDFFYAVQDNGNVVKFNLTSGEGKTEATFQGTTTGATATTKWTALAGSAATPAGKTIKAEYTNQTGKLADLGKFFYVKAEGEGLEPGFDFSKGEALSYLLKVKLPAGVKTVEYTPCAYDTVGVAGTKRIMFNSKDENDYSADKTSTISLSAASAAGDFVYISIPAEDYSRTRDTYNGGKQYCNLKCGIVLTLLNDTEENATLSNGFVYEENISAKGGKFATIDLSSLALIPRPKPADAIEFKADDFQCIFHSSAGKQEGALDTFWAPFNIGASKASEGGWFIAFGEYFDNGVYSYTKYTLHHVKGSNDWVDVIVGGSKKVADGGINGTCYSVANTRYDAARVVWGTSWRMPHCIENNSLYTKSTITAGTVDGAAGSKIANNGNEIFLTKDGYRQDAEDGSAVARDAEKVFIWTADKIQRSGTNPGWNQGYASYFTQDGSDSGFERYDHYAGLHIRPVLTKSTITYQAN